MLIKGNNIYLNSSSQYFIGHGDTDININGNDINIKSVENKYKKLVKKYHPDKHNGDKKYEEKLKKINKAFEEVKKQLTIQ